MQVLNERTPDLHYHVYGVGQLVRDLGRGLRPGRRPARRAPARRRAARRRQARHPRRRSCDKPGPLDDAEWRLMRQHSVIGERILNADPVLQPVARLVRASHERWDGTGYPDGLAGTAIPLGARIIAACDAFDAMTSDRCYQPARSIARGPGRAAPLRRDAVRPRGRRPRCARAAGRLSPGSGRPGGARASSPSRPARAGGRTRSTWPRRSLRGSATPWRAGAGGPARRRSAARCPGTRAPGPGSRSTSGRKKLRSSLRR